MRRIHVGESGMNLNLEERNIKYKELLILSYFQSHYKKYNLNELVRIMGMTYSEMDEFIQHLLNLKQLKIYDNYLVISKSGEQLLEENHMRNFFVNATKKKVKQVAKELNYVPIAFKM